MTGALPTPADVPAGLVVRVRIPGQTYSSKVMPAGDAQTTYAHLLKATLDCGHGDGMVGFTNYDGRVISIRARLIAALEVGPPPPRKEEPKPAGCCAGPYLGLTTERVLELRASGSLAPASSPSGAVLR